MIDRKCKTIGCNNLKRIHKRVDGKGGAGAYCNTCKYMRRRAIAAGDNPDIMSIDELQMKYWNMREAQ